MLKIWVPEELAPEARELLLAFWEWCSRPEREGMLEDEDWTVEQIVDMFLMEASNEFPDA
jgi:hypothetical protein